jgi:hypothetical protein
MFVQSGDYMQYGGILSLLRSYGGLCDDMSVS